MAIQREDRKGLQLRIEVNSAGDVGSSTGYNIYSEQSLKIDAINASGDNIIRVFGKTRYQDTWTILEDITNGTEMLIDVQTYDQIKFECIVYKSSNSAQPVVFSVSGFFNNAGNNYNTRAIDFYEKTYKEQMKTNTLLKELINELKLSNKFLKNMF